MSTLFSEGLADSATQFRHSSRRLKQKAWWQQCRLKLILASVILIILIVISKFGDYVIVISRARGMYGIYCTEAINAIHVYSRVEVSKCHAS